MQLDKSNFTTLAGLSIFKLKKSQLLKKISNSLNQDGFSIIFTPNSEHLVSLQKNQELKQLFRQADCLVPDSCGLLWASEKKYENQKDLILRERITGVDLAQDLLLMMSRKQENCLLIGGYGYQKLDLKEWSIEKCKDLNNVYFFKNEETKTKVYWWSGLTNKQETTQEELNNLERALENVKPKVVFIALGFPDQERFLLKYKSLFTRSGVKIGLVVGGAFDMIFGKIKRAPRLFQKLRLEWLWRLVMEPWRIKRQIKLIDFIFLVLRKKI